MVVYLETLFSRIDKSIPQDTVRWRKVLSFPCITFLAIGTNDGVIVVCKNGCYRLCFSQRCECRRRYISVKPFFGKYRLAFKVETEINKFNLCEGCLMKRVLSYVNFARYLSL